MGETFIPPQRTAARELAYGGLFGAAALALPFLFHLLHLGHIFMPMYIPIMALSFFVRARMAALVGMLIPLLSALTTGMPPLFPPVALAMSVELALMAGLLALLRQRSPDFPVLGHVLPVLLVGRVVNAVMLYAVAALISLPPAFVAGISFIAGWPGLLVMLVILPAVARVSAGLHHGKGLADGPPDVL
jgi:hypothetical protein